MTTTVKVTVHKFPVVVSIRSRSIVRGPSNISETVITTDTMLVDGQSQEFIVTNTQDVMVEELEHGISAGDNTPQEIVH